MWAGSADRPSEDRAARATAVADRRWRTSCWIAEDEIATTKEDPMSKLAGKVAVVTGASKGIGAGIAKGLAAEGAAVVVNYASSKEGADRVVADIGGKGGKAIAVQGDMARSADVKRLFAETKKAFGSLHVLVNNAGVY
jgi:3-oxoacyl-ACP reductase-like protein